MHPNEPVSQQEFSFGGQRTILTVSDIVGQVKEVLEAGFDDVWVRGEISDWTVPRSGHCYFSLKDDDSRVRAVCFRLNARYLKFRPEDGMEVLARGRLSVYPPRGDFQLIVQHMAPVGHGALRLAFEQLKGRLAKEGLFDQAHKKALPILPAKVGLVTSPTGAAIQDILRVLKRRNDRLSVLVFPVKVQGEGAAGQIVAGIRFLNGREDVDVLILARGGGSSEDLWAFNDEAVARAVFASRLPVISAIGHEIDFTIADFVADLRAPTPSAAAEIVSAARSDLKSKIEQLERRAWQAFRLLVSVRRRRLHRLASSRSFIDAESRLRYFSQRLDELSARMARTLPLGIEPLRQALARREEILGRNWEHRLTARRQRLGKLGAQLDAYSPLAVLQRGYAIVSRRDSRIVRAPKDVRVGERLAIQVAGGRFGAKKVADDEV